MSVILKGTIRQTHIVRHGVKIVRQIMKENDFPNGVSTQELYQLAIAKPPPEGFEGDPRLTVGPGGIKGITTPPQNDHPIRSMAFLKRTVLPALVLSGELQKIKSTKEITMPISIVKKGRVKLRSRPDTLGASPDNPVMINTWVWVQRTPPSVENSGVSKEERSERGEKPVKHFGDASEWLHLNTRRHRARIERKQQVPEAS